MKATNPKIGAIRMAAACLAIAALVVSYVHIHDASQFFSSFVVQVNLFGAVLLLIMGTNSLKRKTPRKSASFTLVRGAVTAYVVAVGMNCSKLPPFSSTPLGFWVAGLILYYVMPVVMLLNWLLLAPKGLYKWRYIGYWLIYPLLYVGMVILAGYRPTDFEPIRSSSYAKTFFVSFMVLASGAALCFVMILIDKLIERRLRKREGRDWETPGSR